jgi:hypothetical protein
MYPRQPYRDNDGEDYQPRINEMLVV